MREIKFKAKRKDNNEWVYGNLVYIKYENKYYIVDFNTNVYSENKCGDIKEIDITEVISETLCQYTGLKDKNGVEIYENDIISATEHLTNGYIGIGEVDLYYEVNYIDRLSKYVLNPRIIDGKYNNNNFELDMFHYKVEEIEVIGNVFDKEQK